MSPAVATTCERCGETIWVHVDIVWVPSTDSAAPYRIELVPRLDHECELSGDERAERFETISERMRREHY